MALPPELGTRINGKLYDFSSVEIVVNNIAYQNVTEISYSHGLEPGILRGTGAMWRGRSRGQYESDASFSIYKEDHAALITALASGGIRGYMEQEFRILVSYREAGANLPVCDRLEGCRIKRDDDSHSSGGDVIIVKVDLSVYEVIRQEMHAVDAAGRFAQVKP